MEENLSGRSIHWYSVLQFALSLLAVLVLFGAAFLFLSLGLVAVTAESFGASWLSALLFALDALVCGLLLAPSAYYSLRRLMGKRVTTHPSWPRLLRPTLLIFLLPLVLLLGYWVGQTPGLAWILAPLHILAIGLPVFWVLYLTVHGLPVGSPQRTWGVFGSGLVLGPSIILVLETIVLVISTLLLIVYVANRSEFLVDLNRLVEITSQGQVTPEQIQVLITPWLNRPAIIFGVAFFIGFLVPVIEEALKPIGVWMLVGARLTPAAGFAAGAICGAGFALFESLALTSGGSDWVILVTGRIGAAVIHILNSSLMGWALVLVWRRGEPLIKRCLRLAIVYLLVILVHGAWNVLTLFNAAESLLSQAGIKPDLSLVAWLGPAAPYLLMGMSLVGLAVLLGLNYRLRKGSML